MRGWVRDTIFWFTFNLVVTYRHVFTTNSWASLSRAFLPLEKWQVFYSPMKFSVWPVAYLRQQKCLTLCFPGGVHGANRLAGNSLLECVVFGRIAGRNAAATNYSHEELWSTNSPAIWCDATSSYVAGFSIITLCKHSFYSFTYVDLQCCLR